MKYSFTLCLNVCRGDWFNKEADWPIAGQVEVRWDWQTKTEHWEEEGKSLRSHREKQDELAELKKGSVTWQNIDKT